MRGNNNNNTSRNHPMGYHKWLVVNIFHKTKKTKYYNNGNRQDVTKGLKTRCHQLT